MYLSFPVQTACQGSQIDDEEKFLYRILTNKCRRNDRIGKSPFSSGPKPEFLNSPENQKMLPLLDSTKQNFFCLFTYQNHPNSHSCHPPLKLSLAFFFFSAQIPLLSLRSPIVLGLYQWFTYWGSYGDLFIILIPTLYSRTRFSNPAQLTFWTGQSFVVGDVLYIVGLATSLASIYQVPVLNPTPVVATKNVSRYCQMSPRGVQNILPSPVRTTDLGP